MLKSFSYSCRLLSPYCLGLQDHVNATFTPCSVLLSSPDLHDVNHSVLQLLQRAAVLIVISLTYWIMCIHIRTCLHTYTHTVHGHTCMHKPIHIYTCTQYLYTYTWAHTLMYTCICTHVHADVHTHTYIRIYVSYVPLSGPEGWRTQSARQILFQLHIQLLFF